MRTALRNDNRIENLMLFSNNGKHLSKSLKSIKLIGRLNIDKTNK
jgi:hypothetical protein